MGGDAQREGSPAAWWRTPVGRGQAGSYSETLNKPLDLSGPVFL